MQLDEATGRFDWTVQQHGSSGKSPRMVHSRHRAQRDGPCDYQAGAVNVMCPARGKVGPMTQPSGWYDDPQDPSLLRYWDGVVWSKNVSPKVPPTLDQSTIGMPHEVIAASARPQTYGGQGAEGASAPQGDYGSRPQDHGNAGGQWPAYGQGPGSTAGQQLGWQSNPATTPDGVPLAGWWLRVAARVLDGIFTFVLALPFTGYGYYRYVKGFLAWTKDAAAQASVGSSPVMAFPPWDVLQFAVAASVIGVFVALAYETFFLRRSGATPGKRIVGISVRLRERAGPPPLKAVLLRTGCFQGLRLLSPADLLDALWPLWDDKKQAIHDKVARTNVVVGSQPKRDV
ncbi:MAG: hypothetical protein QOF35_146 [Actinomycetota bacterium]|nr:hypothetical protein [Actinomycetota bacterium]